MEGRLHIDCIKVVVAESADITTGIVVVGSCILAIAANLGIAEIDIEILGRERDILGDAVLEAAGHSPASLGAGIGAADRTHGVVDIEIVVAAAIAIIAGGVGRLDLSVSRAPRAVEEPVVEGDTDTTTNCAEPVDLRRRGEIQVIGDMTGRVPLKGRRGKVSRHAQDDLKTGGSPANTGVAS